MDEGIFYIPELRLTVYGKFVRSDPTWIPSEIYNCHPEIFKIAPINKQYLTELFGRKYFDDVVFELNYLKIQSPNFLRRLADKIGVKRKHITTHAGLANLIRKAIRKKMGI
jgi:hypothetical protein